MPCFGHIAAVVRSHTFHKSYCTFVTTLFRLFIWLFINLVMRLQPCNLGEDANIHKTFAYKYLSNIISTAVEEWKHGYFCLGHFSAPTRFDLVMRSAQKVWRQCVLVFAHGLVAETATVSLRTLAFFFPLVTDTFASFDSLSLHLIQFSHAWRQSFVIEVSDLCFS